MRRVAVVLVNWNGWKDTIECLSSLMGLAHRPAQIVVVDNASQDDSLVQIRAWCKGELVAVPGSSDTRLPSLTPKAPAGLRWSEMSDDSSMPADSPQIVLIRSSLNRGFAGGNNLGIKAALAAGMDYVWLLNTDTVVDPHALGALLDRASVRPDAGIVGSTLIYYWRPTDVQAFGGAAFDAATGIARHLGINQSEQDIPHDPSAVETQMDYVIGASMLVSRSFLEEIGPMCEDYFLYYEEVDWAVRSRGRFAMAYAPGSRVFHKVGGSSRKTASRKSLRYLYRNRLRFVQRFFPEYVSSTRRAMFIQILQHLRRGRWDVVLEMSTAVALSFGSKRG